MLRKEELNKKLRTATYKLTAWVSAGACFFTWLGAHYGYWIIPVVLGAASVASIMAIIKVVRDTRDDTKEEPDATED